jgi:hypothetical protein
MLNGTRPRAGCQASVVRDPQMDLMSAVSAGDVSGIQDAVAAGANPNAGSYHGASVIHYACLVGNVDVVRTLLDLGGDPNIRAEPPGDEILDPTPLDTVLTAQFLLDYDKYSPIYSLLVARGARDSEGRIGEASSPRQGRALRWGTPWSRRPPWLRRVIGLRRRRRGT